MRRHAFLALIAVLPLAAGCIIATERHRTHGGGGVAVVHEHRFLYWPDWYAYSCSHCDEWWVHDSGRWSHHPTRPAGFSVGVDVVFVDVDTRGSDPFAHHDSHRRRYPPGWRDGPGKSDKDRGPPPGRGWRK
jgi:hypothetical protein